MDSNRHPDAGARLSVSVLKGMVLKHPMRLYMSVKLIVN